MAGLAYGRRRLSYSVSSAAGGASVGSRAADEAASRCLSARSPASPTPVADSMAGHGMPARTIASMPSTRPSAWPSACPSAWPSACPSAWPSACPSACPSARLRLRCRRWNGIGDFVARYAHRAAAGKLGRGRRAALCRQRRRRGNGRISHRSYPDTDGPIRQRESRRRPCSVGGNESASSLAPARRKAATSSGSANSRRNQ